ncbi:putative mucin-19-like [Apostichopus japonicus]|uniref:N-glycosylase/DNA lyase n=1 Tax=Stichopus japonicus TaxID=307972 RepID=A0A2G8LC61_STIJA|nr:putative mucin-19-like [Apostichopus japonicus]
MSWREAYKKNFGRKCLQIAGNDIPRPFRKLSQAQIMMAKWSSVPCAKRELSLAVTLSCGQSFRWKEVEAGVWRSVLSGRIWTLKQSEEELLYQVHDLSGEKLAGDDTKLSKSDKRRRNQLPEMSVASDGSEKYSPEAVLRDYFQLQVSLSQLYDKWQSVDNNFAVADCVCLFSLDKTGAIPVDTHVWQIASRDYMPELKTKKSLTDKIYKETGDYFRELFGEYAGWAHSVLFSADLKKFQSAPEETKGPSQEGEIPSQPKKKSVRVNGDL